jgi:hypothetical protein
MNPDNLCVAYAENKKMKKITIKLDKSKSAYGLYIHRLPCLEPAKLEQHLREIQCQQKD